MNWGPLGHVRVDPSAPRAQAVCDVCSRNYNHCDLRWQFQWSGNQLINLHLLVCDNCLDTPAEFLRSVTLPPDPIPISNPRPEQLAVEEPSFASTLGGDNIATIAGDNMTAVEGIVPVAETPPASIEQSD